jgi:(2R)-3-sulfolactate dehydrogenase (NADP+)
MRLSVPEITTLAVDVLVATGAGETAAQSLALSIGQAEADGIRSHGLMRLPTYADHVACGKVDGKAVPRVIPGLPSAVLVDAHHGFAHPAIDLGLPIAIDAARRSGIASLAITRSYNCGVLGQFAERIADSGLIAIGTANSPACVAPWGGTKAVFGTNPIAFAAPTEGGLPLVIDQSTTKVARGEIMLAAREKRSIPLGWAMDDSGAPTTDPQAALAGTLLPAGDHKGMGIALIIEILAAVLTGSTLSADASSFGDNKGGPPGTGQFFILIDPSTAHAGFGARLEVLLHAIASQAGTRLPGARRYDRRKDAISNGVMVDQSLVDALRERVAAGDTC